MHSALLATRRLAQAAPPDVAAGTRIVPIVLVLLLVVGLGLWLGRRALRASGVSTEKRARSAAEREEAFMAMTLALHEARQRGAAPPADAAEPQAAASSPAARASAGARPAFDGPVFCPACGTALGAARTMLRYVTKCPGCARRVSARAEGARVIVDVDVES